MSIRGGLLLVLLYDPFLLFLFFYILGDYYMGLYGIMLTRGIV